MSAIGAPRPGEDLDHHQAIGPLEAEAEAEAEAGVEGDEVVGVV
ncbi:hypothetical protein ABZX74_16365 [Streptomyces olivaceoviridis]